MASVAKNQDDVTIPESPTVVMSPNNCGDVLDSDEDISEDEDDGVAGEEFASALSIRSPSVQRVIAATRTCHVVEATIKHSFLCSKENCDLIFHLEVWTPVHHRIITALSACAATVEKDVKRMSRKFIKECVAIDIFAAGLYAHEVFSSIDTTDLLIRAHLSLLLQITCMEYTEIFQKLIEYSSGGDSLTVKEQVDQALDFAFRSTPLELFPRPVVMDNVYYIVGFLGGQAKKHAKRMAEGSGKQACLLHLSNARFKSRRADGGDLAVLELILDPSVPTKMVEKREMFNGLKYPDYRCWKFFSSVEYVYSTVATADNFVACGGSVLREISESLLSNENLNKKFADLCDTSAKSFSPSDTSTCLQFFLLVFGRVRAKDLALKYRSNLYKGKNITSFRPSIAAHT